MSIIIYWLKIFNPILLSFSKIIRLFNNLYCENTSGGWEKLNSFFLGNSYLLDIQNNEDGSFTENNILFEVESEHDTLVEADDIERSDNINFKFFCDEIFGDC